MEQRKMVEMPMPEGEAGKQYALALVEQNNKHAVAMMRAYAKQHARQWGEVCIEDVRKWAATQGFKVKHHNAFGSVFSHGGFKRIGYRKSLNPASHSRIISVWTSTEDDRHAI